MPSIDTAVSSNQQRDLFSIHQPLCTVQWSAWPLTVEVTAHNVNDSREVNDFGNESSLFLLWSLTTPGFWSAELNRRLRPM